jgi:hypothetical protein
VEKERPIPEFVTNRGGWSESLCGDAAPELLVPNLIHFIFLGEDTPFRFLHYLAILSAHLRSSPDEIIVHGCREPVESPWWNRIKPLITYEPVEPVREFRGRKNEAYQHQADVIRLEKLIERGGIYLDIDVLTLRSLNQLRRYSCVIGGECYRDGREGAFSNDPRDFASVTNAVMMAVPESPFLQEWYERMEIGNDWAHHAVVTPHELILERPELAHVEPVESFMPFTFRDDFVFAEMPPEERALLLKTRFGQSYTVHFWETIWGPRYLHTIDPDYLATRQNLFVDLVGDLPV